MCVKSLCVCGLEEDWLAQAEPSNYKKEAEIRALCSDCKARKQQFLRFLGSEPIRRLQALRRAMRPID